MDLEVARADRHLHPVAVAARLGERAGDRRLADAEEAHDAAAGRPAAREQRARTRSVSSARGHSRCSSDGGPGRTTTTCPSPCGDHEAGSGAREPERDRAVGDRRLLRHARARSPRSRAAAAPPPRARPPRSAPRAPRRRAARRRAPSPPSRRCGRRASGRARPRRSTRRRRARRAAPPRAPPAASPTIAIRAGSSPRRSASRARNGPFRSVRSPRTSSLPVTTMRARGRLKRPRATVRRRRDEHLQVAGRPAARRPCRRSRRARRRRGGRRARSASRRSARPCPWRASPGGAPRRSRSRARTSTYVPRFTPVSFRPPTRGRRARRRLRLHDRRRARVAAAELPGDDHERGQRGDAGEREQRAPCARCRDPGGRAASDAPRCVLEPVADEARAELVDVELAVEPEVLGVRAQEALDVRAGPAGSSNCSSSSARMYFARIFVASSICG